MRAPMDPLGKLLIRTGALDDEVLDDVLGQQRHTLPLGSLCYVLGYLDEDTLARALSRQYGVPSVVLDRTVISLDVLEGVPRATALRYNVLPIYEDDRRIFIAAHDPRSVPDFLRELGFIRGKTPVMHVALHITLARTLRSSYIARERGDTFYRGPLVGIDSTPPGGMMTVVSDTQASADGADGFAPVDEFGVEEATRELVAFDIIDTSEEITGVEEDDTMGATSESLPRFPSDYDALVIVADEPADHEMDSRSAWMSRADSAAEETDPEAPGDSIHGEPAGHPDRHPTEVTHSLRAHAITEDGRAETYTEVHDIREHLATLRPGQRWDEPGERKRALIVDSDFASRHLLVKALQPLDLVITTATTGGEAIRQLKAGPPDVVIIDAMLPEIDGFQICRAIKQSAKYQHIAVVLMSTAMDSAQVTEEVLQLYEAEAYFEKPVELEPFTRRIQQLIKVRGTAPITGDDDRFDRAIALYKAGNIDQAIHELRAGLEIDPLSARHHFVLANLLQKQSQIYEAIDEYETTIELKPDYFPALTRLAYLYYKQGFSARAIEMWRRSLPHCNDAALRENIEAFMRKIIAEMHSEG